VKKIRIDISRLNPEIDEHPSMKAYEVPVEHGSTVLESLLYIYTNVDSTLAFQYGCRFKCCGLCAVNIDGKSKLACITRVSDGMKVTPLNNYQVVKDLIVNKRPVFNLLRKFKPFVVREQPPKTEPEVIIQSREHAVLMECRECMACMSACPKYDYTNTSFGGPYIFVKLAQLFYDPRDSLDRRDQAHRLGIERCKDCKRCICTVGIPIYQLVIKPLLVKTIEPR